MSVLIPGGPVLVLPAGTEAAEAERLSRLLDAHGVSGLLGAMDAVAAMVSVPATGSKPAPARKKTTAKPKGKAGSTSSAGPWCGQPNRSGMPCRRPPSCPYHRRPVSDTAPAVATEVVPASVADEDGDGDEEVAEADGATDATDGGDAREAAGGVTRSAAG